jgi:DNA-binding transcriptional regulator YiaG
VAKLQSSWAPLLLRGERWIDPPEGASFGCTPVMRHDPRVIREPMSSSKSLRVEMKIMHVDSAVSLARRHARTSNQKSSRMSAYEALKVEIRRLARKEAKTLVDGATKALRGNKKHLAELKKQVAELKREVASIRRSAGAVEKHEQASAKGAPTRGRITAKGIVSLRARLGVSQGELGRLCGVGGGAVSHWEAQRSSPKGDALATLMAIRGLGKKEVVRRLSRIE